MVVFEIIFGCLVVGASGRIVEGIDKVREGGDGGEGKVREDGTSGMLMEISIPSVNATETDSEKPPSAMRVGTVVCLNSFRVSEKIISKSD